MGPPVSPPPTHPAPTTHPTRTCATHDDRLLACVHVHTFCLWPGALDVHISEEDSLGGTLIESLQSLSGRHENKRARVSDDCCSTLFATGTRKCCGARQAGRCNALALPWAGKSTGHSDDLAAEMARAQRLRRDGAHQPPPARMVVDGAPAALFDRQPQLPRPLVQALQAPTLTPSPVSPPLLLLDRRSVARARPASCTPASSFASPAARAAACRRLRRRPPPMSVASDDSDAALAAAVADMDGSGAAAFVPPPLPPGTLKMLVQGATGLDSLVTVGSQEPYYILEVGDQRSRSKPCQASGVDPIWNTAHKFSLSGEPFAKVGRGEQGRARGAGGGGGAYAGQAEAKQCLPARSIFRSLRPSIGCTGDDMCRG